jgi:protein gp37
MAETTIEWADFTFNPWTGCTKVSPGCDHCYAEGWAKRSGHVEWGPHAARRRTAAATWQAPLKWNLAAAQAGRRARVFCASLADVFDNHPSILSEWRADLWALIAATPNLDWLLLTKRTQNIEMRLPLMWRDGWPNVWLGTTVENQTEANRRILHLLDTPARVRFLSCEPLIERVTPNLDGIHWVICGGESGPGARPMHPDWARSLRDQCQAAGVAYFFKQWGEWAPYPNPRREEWGEDSIVDMNGDEGAASCVVKRVGVKAAGDLLDGVRHQENPAP